MIQRDHNLAAIATSHREPQKVPRRPPTSRTLAVIAQQFVWRCWPPDAAAFPLRFYNKSV